MPALGELLERFRRAATPGPPAAAGGVPDDAAADLKAELRPLIGALDEIVDEARAVLDAAVAEAAVVRERGARDAERILEDARLEATRLRTAPCEDAGDEEAGAILASSEAEADAIRRRARTRIPDLVARVTSCVRGGPQLDVDGLHLVRETEGVAGVGRG